ncbi:MAG: hypothetical protein ACRENP_21485 [Longimicrobiales bacterium]
MATVGYGTLALLFATLIRNAGPALGVFFLYSAFVERLIAQILSAIDPTWVIGRYLPTGVFNALAQPGQWSPALRGRPSNFLTTEQVYGLAALYAGAFLLIAFLIFRKRDL